MNTNERLLTHRLAVTQAQLGQALAVVAEQRAIITVMQEDIAAAAQQGAENDHDGR